MCAKTPDSAALPSHARSPPGRKTIRLNSVLCHWRRRAALALARCRRFPPAEVDDIHSSECLHVRKQNCDVDLEFGLLLVILVFFVSVSLSGFRSDNEKPITCTKKSWMLVGVQTLFFLMFSNGRRTEPVYICAPHSHCMRQNVKYRSIPLLRFSLSTDDVHSWNAPT